MLQVKNSEGYLVSSKKKLTQSKVKIYETNEDYLERR